MATTYDFVTYNQQMSGGRGMGDGNIKTPSQGTRSQFQAFNNFPTLSEARNTMSRGSHARGMSQQDNIYDRANATAGSHRRGRTQMQGATSKFLEPMREEGSNQDIRTYNSSVQRLIGTAGTAR